VYVNPFLALTQSFFSRHQPCLVSFSFGASSIQLVSSKLFFFTPTSPTPNQLALAAVQVPPSLFSLPPRHFLNACRFSLTLPLSFPVGRLKRLVPLQNFLFRCVWASRNVFFCRFLHNPLAFFWEEFPFSLCSFFPRLR